MNSKLALELTSDISAGTRGFAPELVLCAAIVLMLLFRLLPRYDKDHMGWYALVVSAGVLLLSVLQWPNLAWNELDLTWNELDPRRDYRPYANWMSLFGGMVIMDDFTVFLRVFLYGFMTLVVALTLISRVPDREDAADFYSLLFGATIGMSLMASAGHLLMVFIGIEMASLPSYAMAGFLKSRRQSSEAALKYVVYGGGASGVMLYGISLLTGVFGTGNLFDLTTQITSGVRPFSDPLVAMGLVFILAGIAFKLAIVPFHFWCPDVFEGAAAEVGAFLSVASKGAALALLTRIVLGLGGLAGGRDLSDPAALRRLFENWSTATDYLVPVLAAFAIVTTTFGNLAAYGQTNLKRLLAYSTIAHAGFMMMGLATMTREGAGAVLFYLVIYLFMNLGAFAVVAFMRNLTGHEDLSYFRGFVYRAPILVIMLGVFLLSLLGLPPLGGFAAKFQIFAVLFDSAQDYQRAGKPFLSGTMYVLLIAGGLNTVLSLFYYVKVLKVMVLEKTLEEVEDRPVVEVPVPIAQALYATVLAAVILALGIFWNPLVEACSSDRGVSSFRAAPDKDALPVVAPVPPKSKLR